ncbi:NAD(P)/FAD-dependent oxidoreductase [Yinghuangia sp. ASG 101]|uniref:NAD(P)/FAD-dependent oxidoreductase n=1 Tax=Yinghuangia sp. ASG 101 TaxID=2896848 RepID=UPI001E65D747|nr:NAD(P)/FAD-dependent oxidoreductase [Yinghuangia sp. ASG 101]UGQ12925.1 NAD(P)/FAD-dependent oxidoreductase [Yinghuangia sp. ASG 101]
MTAPRLDILVVGGGPAGLATALHAARAGFLVAVAEPRPAPVDKACGEGLMPGGVRALHALGVHPPGQPFAGIRYVRDDRVADARFRAGHGLGVRRTDLHHALADAVVKAGVPILPLRVTRVCQDASGVTAYAADRGTREILRARRLVAADGLHSPLRRALGLDAPARALAGAPRYGLRRHYAVAPASEFVEVHWGDRAEAYVTPLAPDRVGVAILTRERTPYDRQLAAFPELAARLQFAEPVTPVRGAGPLRQRATRRVRGRVLLAGDAAGYVDAITGEGIALALAGAEALVACLAHGRPEAYDAAWLRLTRRYRVATGALLGARRHPATARRIVPAAARFPRLFTAAVDALAHT